MLVSNKIHTHEQKKECYPEKKKYNPCAIPTTQKITKSSTSLPPFLSFNAKTGSCCQTLLRGYKKSIKTITVYSLFSNLSYLGYALGVSWGTQAVLVHCFDQKCSNRISIGSAPLAFINSAVSFDNSKVRNTGAAY